MADKDALVSFQRKRLLYAALKKRSRRSDIAKRAVADVEARRKEKDRAQLETIEIEKRFFSSRYDDQHADLDALPSL